MRNKDRGSGAQQIGQGRAPQLDEETVAELPKRRRHHRGAEAGRDIILFFAVGERLAAIVEANDLQAAAGTDDDAVFEDACRLQRTGGEAASQCGKEDRKRNECEKQPRDKRRCRTAAARIVPYPPCALQNAQPFPLLPQYPEKGLACQNREAAIAVAR